MSYTKVTYGTERNISVCRCTVKRGMLSCFPFMICQQKAAASTAEVYISRPVYTKESKQKTSVFIYFFFPTGGWKNETHEHRINSDDIEFGRDAKSTLGKSKRWKKKYCVRRMSKREKRFHSLWQKHGIMRFVGRTLLFYRGKTSR